jgi:hypothetical protein
MNAEPCGSKSIHTAFFCPKKGTFTSRDKRKQIASHIKEIKFSIKPILSALSVKNTKKLYKLNVTQKVLLLYLLHLELDGGLEIVGLGGQVIVVGHQGRELPSLGSQSTH